MARNRNLFLRPNEQLSPAMSTFEVLTRGFAWYSPNLLLTLGSPRRVAHFLELGSLGAHFSPRSVRRESLP